MAKLQFRVRPYKNAKYKFVVRGKVDGKWSRHYFVSESEAIAFARKQNGASEDNPSRHFAAHDEASVTPRTAARNGSRRRSTSSLDFADVVTPTYRGPQIERYLGDSWCMHLPFAYDLMREFAPKVFVELGVKQGESYFTFCQSAAENQINVRCYGIDSWKGDVQTGPLDPAMQNEVAEYNWRYSSFSELRPVLFEEALDEFPDASIDLLHIDGTHTYEAVKADFESWLPKLSSKGIVLFHDVVLRDRGFGVWKLWEELQAENRSFLFEFGYGLGVWKNEAVTDEDPPFLQKLFRATEAEKRDINSSYATGATALALWQDLRKHSEAGAEASQLRRATDELASLRRENEEKARHAASLQTEFDEKVRHVSLLEREIAEKADQVTHFQGEADKATNALAILRDDFQEKAKHVRLLQNENETKTEQVLHFQRDVEEKARHIGLLQNENEEKAKQVLTFQRESEDKAKQVLAFQQELEEKARHIRLLQSETEEKTKQLLAFQREGEERARHARLLQNENEEKTRQALAARREAEENARRLAELQTALQAKSTELSEAGRLAEKRRAELAELNRELSRQKSELERATDKHTQLAARLHDQLGLKDERLAQASRDLLDAEWELLTLRAVRLGEREGSDPPSSRVLDLENRAEVAESDRDQLRAMVSGLQIDLEKERAARDAQLEAARQRLRKDHQKQMDRLRRRISRKLILPFGSIQQELEKLTTVAQAND